MSLEEKIKIVQKIARRFSSKDFHELCSIGYMYIMNNPQHEEEAKLTQLLYFRFKYNYARERILKRKPFFEKKVYAKAQPNFLELEEFLESLTDEENNVLKLKMQGYQNQEIAKFRGVANSTITLVFETLKEKYNACFKSKEK